VRLLLTSCCQSGRVISCQMKGGTS
jgi:hypothetical protein